MAAQNLTLEARADRHIDVPAHRHDGGLIALHRPLVVLIAVYLAYKFRHEERTPPLAAADTRPGKKDKPPARREMQAIAGSQAAWDDVTELLTRR